MFTIYHSNKVDVLKSLLANLIKQKPLTNPFIAEQILVQSPGMSQWLKMELAIEMGIAANIDFPLPASFIWEMFIKILPNMPKVSAFNKEAMTWKLMVLLPSMLHKPEFAPLAFYLQNDLDQDKLYQLTSKIADIFDGYLVYRPEWIASWENGKDVDILNDEHPWQAMLWRKLCEHTINLNQSHYHRANLYNSFIKGLKTCNVSLLPERLFIFGISSLPPAYLNALKALGQYIDVHLMFTNPCRYYWGDIYDPKFLAKISTKYQVENKLVGNSLLASMGKLGRDNLYLLAQLEENEIDAFVDIAQDSLLHHIQHDILNLIEHQDHSKIDSSTHKQIIDKSDQSISFHACHSPMREVEVLYDQLLGMFDADPNLKPRDIIVMVADINTYSPAIEAVFASNKITSSSSLHNKLFIPYSISDLSLDRENLILVAFLKLLQLPLMRCQASDILDILEVPAILRQFDLSRDDFVQIKLWVQEVGIRWGLDENTAIELDLPAIKQNTWSFGIERLLLGYAMAGEIKTFTWEKDEVLLAPYNEVQGFSAEIAGNLAYFIEQLRSFRILLAQNQSIESWQKTLLSMLSSFFAPDLHEEIILQIIRNIIDQLKEQLEKAAYKDDLPAVIIRKYLQEKLSSSKVSQRFLAGQVNFCTLMPMRSIPFKVVCLLGMNEDSYPRSVVPNGFDLMVGRMKAGDRSRRDDDRYLFLEALLSAENKLYISYIGYSIYDNTTKSPSVLVTELLEYCQQNYCLADDSIKSADLSAQNLLKSLVMHHYLTPFSERAFSVQSKLDQHIIYNSYASHWLTIAKSLQNSDQIRSSHNLEQGSQQSYIEQLDSHYQLELIQLQKFWHLPVKYFFNNRLKVFFNSHTNEIEDAEPFKLSGLDNYQIREQLLDKMLMQSSSLEFISEQTQQELTAEGKLPFGAFGKLDFNANNEQILSLVDNILPLIATRLDDVEINLSFNLLGKLSTNEDSGMLKDLKITGWLKGYYRSGLVRYRCGALRAQDRLSAWIEHLALAAAGYVSSTHLIGFTKENKILHLIYDSIENTKAFEYLTDLILLFFAGMDAPLPYFPKIALAGIKAQLKAEQKEDDHQKIYETVNTKMQQIFDGNQQYAKGDDLYINRIWENWDQNLADQALKLAHKVLLPAYLSVQDAAK